MEALTTAWRHHVDLEAKEEQLEIEACLNQLSALELEKRDRAVLNVSIDHVKFGWFGKLLITFKSANPFKPTINSFRSGEILGIYKHSKSYQIPINATFPQITTGVVHHCTGEKIKLSLEQSQYQELAGSNDVSDLIGSRFSLALAGSDVTYKRRRKLIERIQRSVEQSHDSTQQALFTILMGGDDIPRQPPQSDNHKKLARLLESLNTNQKEAILACVEGDPCNVIYGPPGTGKTTTVVALIKCLVELGHKVLATAPSNTAVDNMMERCDKMRMVRLGHPSRISALLHSNMFEKKAQRSDAYKLCEDIKEELAESLEVKKEGKLKGSKEITKRLDAEAGGDTTRRAVRAAAQREIGLLHKELRQRERQVAREILDQSDVVFCTCVGADSEVLTQYLQEGLLFDYVIIDEAGQSTEVDCWMPILRGKRLVLAGDPQQLPATIKSKENLESSQAESLLEKTMRNHPENTRFLSTQYRMHENIMSWSSKVFYDGRLVSAESCKNRRLANESPLQWIDTGNIGSDCLREDPVDSNEKVVVTTKSGATRRLDTSRSNIAEALVCVRVLEKVCGENDDLMSIGVITPYKDQTLTLSQVLKDSPIASRNIKISTVDGFQGQERDIILMSLVRSNVEKVIGFLVDRRRLNVAVTRAKRLVIVVGDSSCVCAASDTFRSLFEHIENTGEVTSALAFVPMQDLENIRVDYGRCHVSKPVRGLTAKNALREPNPAKTPPSRKLDQERRTSPESARTRSARGSPKSESPKQSSEPRGVARLSREEEDLWISRHREMMSSLTATNSSLKCENLTSFQRMKLHELAESLGLKHYSTTQADDKRLLVIELPTATKTTNKNRFLSPNQFRLDQDEEMSAASSGGSKKEAVLRSSGEISRSHSATSVAKSNSGSRTSPLISSKSKRKASTKATNDTNRSVAKNTGSTKDTNKDDNDDDLLDRMVAESEARAGRCSFEGCNQKVNILNLICRHCLFKYCYEHGIPEAHGCTQAARDYARRAKPLNAQQHANVEKKLRVKMEEERAKRIAKKSK